MKLEMPEAVVFLSLLIILGSCINGFALESVEWNIQKTLKLEQAPIDVALASDGNRMFVLTQQGEIIIYSAGGDEQARLKVGNHVDSIKLGSRGDTLILQSRENKTIQIVSLDFILDINVAGSPYKGPPNAPVTIAVFSDFQ